MNSKRRLVSSHSCEHFVILVALVFVVRVAQAATTTRPESFEADLSASNSSSPTQILPSIICETASNTSFNCSNLKLSKIPTNLPKSIVQLNLSHNNFRQFDDDAFDECCENVRELDLSSNEISSLTRRHFERMNNLEVLLLSVNKLVTLDADTFSHLTKLQRLDLSRNPVELQGSDSKGFLVSTNIEELNLDYCNITDIPDGTFTNLTQLLNLTLAGNLLDKDIDESSFKPLHNLIKLRITNLSESSTYRLCNVLTAIDTILFDEFNITCLVLSNDGAFEDSIVPNDPVEEPKIDSVISQPVTARKVTAAQTTTASLVQPSPAPTVTESSTSLPQPQVIEISDEAYTNKTKLEPETASMNIDNDTMKFILIGIFGVTVFGIIIGLICRADVCGIKTKLCRSKKSTTNRRSPTDNVSPFEEIPLNSTNGKATEGHG